MRSHRIYGMFIVPTVLAVLVLWYAAYRIGCVNMHRFVDDLPDYDLRARVEQFYCRNRRAPQRLSDLVCVAERTDRVKFSTTFGWPCELSLVRRAGTPSGGSLLLKCGDPPIVDFLVAGDGSTMREHWYGHGWLRALEQHRKPGPRLGFREGPPLRSPAEVGTK